MESSLKNPKFLTCTHYISGMFIEEINNSYNDLHDMYDRTYGELYLSNSAIFSQFYKKLSDHLDLSRISRPSHKLQQPEDTVDRFFEELMWKIINLFPGQKISSSNYNKYLYLNDIFSIVFKFCTMSSLKACMFMRIAGWKYVLRST